MSVKDNFIDLDPERFKVRVTDKNKVGEGIVEIALGTISAYPTPNDDPTGMQLHEEPANSGTFISTNQLLVVDDIDDDFSNSLVLGDDAGNDRTHRIGLGGRVYVRYPWWGDVCVVKEIEVPKAKTVNVVPVIMREETTNGWAPVMTVAEVNDRLFFARKRFAQVGVDLTWDDPIVCNPPEGVNLADGLLVRTATNSHVLAIEAKFAIYGVGTVGNTNDIHLIYVNRLMIVGGDAPLGSAVAHYWYTPSSEASFLDNVFVSVAGTGDPERGGCVIAHELGHLLTDRDHTNLAWRLMYERPWLDGVKGSRRFVSQEETLIRGNPHAYPQGN